MKNWYSIKNTHEKVLDISLHDEIGLWGISAKDFIEDLRNHKNVTSINLSVHSPGGSVLDGLAIYNALKSHPAKVYGSVDGIAASAASFILMAADSVAMPEDSFLMIHNAQGGAFGESSELRAMADVMEKLQDSIVNIYEKRTGLSEENIREMMAAKTWLNASDALEKGFIDTISDAIQVAAKIGVFNKYFKSMPVDNAAGVSQLKTIRDFENFLRDSGGLSKSLATALSSQAKIVFKGEPETVENSEFEKIAARLQRVKLPTH